METQEKQRFESWRSTKHFTAASDVENDELLKKRIGTWTEGLVLAYKDYPIANNEVVGYFSYKNSSIILMTDDGRFYREKHKPCERLESAEIHEWYALVEKTWQIEPKVTFLDTLKKIEESGVTTKNLAWIVDPTFSEILEKMIERKMTLLDLIRIMNANQIDGDDIEHLQEKFYNHIEDCYPGPTKI